MRLTKGCVERMKMALGQDPRLVVDREKLAEAQGFSQEYFEQLGLSQSDLQRLEWNGLAIKGRMPTKRGHITRWLLVGAMTAIATPEVPSGPLQQS